METQFGCAPLFYSTNLFSFIGEIKDSYKIFLQTAQIIDNSVWKVNNYGENEEDQIERLKFHLKDILYLMILEFCSTFYL